MFNHDMAYSQPATNTNCTASYRELNRLLSAAIISTGFRNMLITNPEIAIAKGYQGEKFELTNDEYRWLLSVQATDIAGFASQLLDYQNTRKPANEQAIAVNFPAMAQVS